MIKERLSALKDAAAAWGARIIKAVKHFLFGGSLAGVDLSEKERRAWGMCGNHRTATFWLTTLWFSLALGICSAMNGFAPFDMVLQSLGYTDLHPIVDQAVWRYALVAIAGCAAYNTFIARKHSIDGYRRTSYCWSIVSAAAFMTLTKAVYYLIERAGAL